MWHLKHNNVGCEGSCPPKQIREYCNCFGDTATKYTVILYTVQYVYTIYIVPVYSSCTAIFLSNKQLTPPTAAGASLNFTKISSRTMGRVFTGDSCAIVAERRALCLLSPACSPSQQAGQSSAAESNNIQPIRQPTLLSTVWYCYQFSRDRNNFSVEKERKI